MYHWILRGEKIILLSPRLFNNIAKLIKKENCFFLANGIDEPNFYNTNIIKKKSENKIPILLFFSSMHSNKGPLILLSALSKLYKRNLHFRAIFAGPWASDNLSKKFFSLVKEYRLNECISYVGPKFGNEKTQLFINSDIFVYPTLNDAFPLVILEAMSYGLPVISTIEGAIPDIVIDGETGFLVQKHDENSLSQAIEILLSDMEIREKFGLAGKERFNKYFRKEIFEKNLCQILSECLKKQINFKPVINIKNI